MSAAPRADAVCDGGDLDCGSGLLLIIREAMSPLSAGGVLEVRSREASVRVDLPAWCRLVGHTLESVQDAPSPPGASYFIRKAAGADATLAADLQRAREFFWSVRVRAAGAGPAKGYARNHSLEIGQAASFDTTDPAPSAVEVFLAALGAELAAALRWRASRRGIAIHECEVSLRARPNNILVFLGAADDGHAGIERIEGRLFVDADAAQETLEEIWRDTLARSLLAQTLARGAVLDIPIRLA